MSNKEYTTIIETFDASIVLIEKNGRYFIDLDELSSSSKPLEITKQTYDGLVIAAARSSTKGG